MTNLNAAASSLNPANLDPESVPRDRQIDTLPKSPLDLIGMIKQAKADNDEAAAEPVTIADVAAAAFVALETVVALMPTDELKQQVIAEFESRAAVFAVTMEDES